MPRPMTMTEQVLARAAGLDETRPGEIVVTRVDHTVLIDSLFLAAAIEWRPPLVVADPERISVVIDHAVPAAGVVDANAARMGRELAAKFGLRLHDVGRHGISHQIVAELGLARPGELLLCSDSHTGAGGAFNCAARGVGGLEMLQVVCTGTTWFVVSPSIAVELTGELPEGSEGKDVFLALAGAYGSAANANLEFGGAGVARLSLHDRRTIATQCAEINAEFAIFPADGVVVDYLAERGVAAPLAVAPHDGAEYADRWRLDLGDVEPMVATPGGVIGNVKTAAAVSGVRLDQCFIGSCANGHIEDFATAAELLAGRRVADGVRLIVTPSSQQVFLDAVEAGYVSTIVEAGGVVTPSTCGACWGYHMGVLGDGEVCLTSSTRNFKGRMGSPDAEIYMASTRTVAASALAGHIVDPREAMNVA